MGRHDTQPDDRRDDRLGGARRTATIFALTGAIALTACTGQDDAASSEPADELEATTEMSGEDLADASESSASDSSAPVMSADAGGENPERSPADGGFDIGVIGRDVIIEMRVVVSSDDIQRTVASVMASASTLGGGVASSDVDYGSDDGEGFAVLVVKVPPQSVDRLLDALGDTGEVQSINQSAQDVTEQLVNLDIRIANARASVDNVRDFMDRTENLNELVSLEAELTRRRTDLEQLEAQQRNIADRVALSTITIEVVSTATVPGSSSDDDRSIGHALRSGWGAFAAFVLGIAFVVAAALPFLVAGLVVAVAVWMWARRRATRPFDSPSPATNGHNPDTDDTDDTLDTDDTDHRIRRRSEPVR